MTWPKWLSYYLYFFSFLFVFGLTIQERSAEKYHMTCYMLHVTDKGDVT